jgi:hypothetical protein
MRFAVLILLAVGCRDCCGEFPKLLDQMIQSGITMPGDAAFPVRPPTLDQDLDAQQRRQRLEALAGPLGWQRFSRNSVTAPVAIQLKYLKAADGRRIGHDVHVAFILHTSLEKLKDEKFMKELFGEPEDPEAAEDFQSSELTTEQLGEIGVTAEPDSTYGSVQMPILKRVIVRGVIQAQQSVTDDRIIFAWQFDPRLSAANLLRNTWAPVNRDDAGRKSEGAQRPYAGTGGYLIVSRLPEVAGACFVESHMVIHEPADWFSSSNQLRSKMPILIQESVRSMRRKLTPN